MCTVGVLLALPATAPAKPGYEVESASLESTIRLRGSNGFAISIGTFGHRRVTVAAKKGNVFALYSVKGRVTSRGIDADLGRLGRISLRFEGVHERPPETLFPSQKCWGPDPVREFGNFRGVIRFNGERRYTQVRVARAWGSVTRSHRRICEELDWPLGPRLDRAPEKDSSIPLTVVGAVSRAPEQSIYLQTVAAEGPRRGPAADLFLGFATAAVTERQGRIAIVRTALTSFGRLAIALADRGEEPRSATVNLPKPFSGRAAYAKELGTPASWTGSLGVWLPGLGTVPLSGPDFDALVCRSKREALIQRCEALSARTADSPLALRAAAPSPTTAGS
jgi:hypothetical protein